MCVCLIAGVDLYNRIKGKKENSEKITLKKKFKKKRSTSYLYTDTEIREHARDIGA